MPPRRSSRSSTITSVPPADKQTSIKRKRNQSDLDEYPANEKENVTKPSSASRKPTSARSSVGATNTRNRASARSQSSLKEVSEVDEGPEDSPPPVKRKRPSTETEPEPEQDEESSDDEIEEPKPVTTRRGTTVRKPSTTRASKGGMDRVLKTEEAKSNSRSLATRGGSLAPTRKSTRGSVKPAEEEPASIAISDSEEEEKPVVRNRKSHPEPSPDTEEGSSDHGSAQIAKGRNTATKSRISPRRPGSRTHQVVYSSEDETSKVSTSSKPDLPSERESHTPEPKPDVSTVDGKDNAEDQNVEVKASENVHNTRPVSDMEEEYSLLDPPSVPRPRTQLPAVQSEDIKGPQARLVIHKMALVNFKSYAGRQEIGPFHKSFSAIVGPNGSGKSNTIDALLFVFGYRATKMRQGKLSELIHNSARYPNLQECSVEIHFREIIDLPGPDAFEIVPGSQLIVSRTAYKNNNSKYTIDGRASTYKEVQTLLKGRDIDLDHNRFLILQGEVEAIALMKPKAPSEHEDGLLEYLEDIIGTSRFKEPLEEAFTEMERLSEDRADKLNRLRITEKEKNALEEKKGEAEDYLRLQNEHVRAQSRLWQWYLWKCLVNEEEFVKRISQLTKELTEERERNKDDITHHEMLQEHYLEREKAYAEIKDAANEAIKDLAKHEKQQIGLEERKKHASSKTKKLKKSIQDDERVYNEAQRAFDNNSSKIEKEKSKVEQYEADLGREEKVLEEIRDSLKDKTQTFHDQIEVKQKELQPWTSKINAKQAEIDIATSERDALIKKAEAAEEARKQAETNLESLQEDHRAKVSELAKLKTRKSEISNESSACQQNLQGARNHVQELRQKASSTRQRVDEAKSSQASNKSHNQVLDSLTKLQNSGRINGFHGRLGNLGTIPDKYDVAVTTAAGALNHLLVDTVDQGQACIEYLRKQNIGRASFMVLEKLPQRSIERIPTPENVPRLFDLIKPKEPRFAAAFYKAVGNTLVAEDMNQANRIAYGPRRWRVVTLAGQVIDSSGTMSGGGNNVLRGGMSSKFAADAVSPAVLKQYEQDSEDAVAKLDDALKELRRIESLVDDLARSNPQIDLDIQKVGLDIQNGAKRISEAERRVRELQSKSKPDTADGSRISSLDNDIDSASEELQKLQQNAATIEDAIKALEKKILEIGGARLLTQKSKVDGLKLHINLANDEVTKAEVAKRKAEKDTAKFAKSIESNKEDFAVAEKDLEELNEQVKECARYVEEIRSKVEDAKVAQDNSKDDLEKLKAELDEKTEQIRGFKKREMELVQQLQTLNKDNAENGKALEHWRNEHDKLRLEEIDDDDDEEEEAPNTGDGAKVKPEPGQQVVKKNGHRQGTPSYELHIYTVEELQQFKQRDMVADTELLDEKLKNAKPNLSVLKEYRKREEEFLNRAQDLENVTKRRDDQKQKYDSLRKQRLDEFMTGFNTISFKLKEMYQMITLGGNAELELVDSMDPFSEGIIFSVMPPKKSWRNISNLSGGEKTLSSLALVFALHAYKPTPLYFMDEIDAALDFRNVSIVANYIKDRTKNAQFIIISLRNDMFELSHRLIGIYKTANATQSVSIDNFALNVVPVVA